MKDKTILLRISYWFGAVLDGVMVIPMLFPRVGGAMFGIDNFNPGDEYKYAMMIGASLMDLFRNKLVSFYELLDRPWKLVE